MSEQDPHRTRLAKAVVAIKKLQARMDESERAKREPIAILGVGCRIPGGSNDPESFWRLLLSGVDTAGPLPPDRWNATPLLDENPYTPGKMFTRYGNYVDDVAGFDPQFFGIAPREAISLDPQQRFLLETSWEALEHAGQAPDALSGSRTGVFVGMGVDDYAQFYLRSGDYTDIDAYACSGAGLCFGAGRVSYVLGLQGPCMNVDTACTSTLNALHLACQSLRADECDLALAGGVNLILSPEVAIGMSALRALSPDGRCRAFDASADGFGRGEGCGMFVLKRLSAAVAAGDPITAVILGSSINHDGPSSGLMVPNGLAQQALLRDALSRAGLKPTEVQYVEAHGTGTALGDPIELEALSAVYGEGRPAGDPLLVGSVKTNVGHLEAAAGVAGVLKVALALERGEIPPHLHFKTPSPHIPWDRIPVSVTTRLTPWPAREGGRVGAVSAFGMSGTNVHMILGEAPPAKPKPESSAERPLHLLRLSTKTPGALRDMAARLAEHLTSNPEIDFADACFTANTGRAQFAHRTAVVAATASEAAAKLLRLAAGEEAAGTKTRQVERRERPKVAFLFTGQGGQYAGMGGALYETQPTFRAALDQCDEILRPLLDRSVLSVIHPRPDEDPRIDETAYTQPALFALEYALAELWRSWGVEPSAVIGHSVGEYAAACVAGVFSLEDGLKLVAARGRLMQALPASGAMAAVFADRGVVEEALRSYSAEVSVAGVNGPEETSISGSTEAIEKILRGFEAAGVKARRLSVSHAFHSPLIEPMLDEFERVATGIRYQEPRIPVISNVKGERLRLTDLEGGAYWRRHARAPVEFMAGLRTLHAEGVRVFLETGPKPILAGLGRQVLAEEPLVWLASLRAGQDDWKTMLDSLAALHLEGVPVDWRGFDRDYARRLVRLPTYPFQRTRFWRERPLAGAVSSSSRIATQEETLHPLLQRRVALPLRERVFESTLRADSPAYLGDHRVQGAAVFPATGYLEMALSAARQVLGEGAHVLEGVRFREPLVLRDGAAETVQLVLTPEDQGEWRFEIRRRVQANGGDEEDAWCLHAHGRLKAGAEHMVSRARRRLSEIEARCREEIAPRDYYERFRLRGMEYGAGFRALTSIRRSMGESLGQVELSGEAAPYCCHPVLLDAALQVMATGVDDSFADRGAGVPLSVDSFCVYRRPQGKVWSHTVVRPNPDGMGVSGDAELLDEQGEVVAEVRGLHVRQMAGRPAAEAGPAPSLYEVRWPPVDPPAATGEPAPRSWAIIPDRAGLGMRLVEALKASGDRCRIADCLEECGGEQFTDLVSLQALDRVSEEPAFEALEAVSDALTVVQGLVRLGSESRLWFVTRGAVRTGFDGVAPVALAQAPVWGFCAVAALEHPELRCTCVDLDPGGGETSLEDLVNELRGASAENRVAWRDSRRYAARLTKRGDTEAARPVRLESTQPGLMEGLELRPVAPAETGPGEVAIRVHTTGLNFRDVLNTLGLYPGDAGPLGDECSGVVTALGPGVEDLHVGDEVVALASGAFATHVVASSRLTVRMPTGVAPEAAAGTPIAFLTARRALCDLARLQAGERVLIHAAAGGVGLAAVRVAQRLGAEVFATAGSAEKRRFLEAEGVRYIFDSRSAEFAERILDQTGGCGVDVVLNSLSGELIEASFRVMARSGRFVEIGKRDIWSAEQVAAVRPDVAYHPFHLGEWMRTEPDQVRAALMDILDDIANRRTPAPPLRVFGANQAAEAFRFVAQARHIGKVVVRQPGAGALRLASPNATYLITGGLGALGLRAARWLVERGARNLVLVSRRTPGEEASGTIRELEAGGARVLAIAADVSLRADVERVLAEVDRAMPPLRGVIHAAGVLDDGAIALQDRSRFAGVFAPKVAGAWNLHILTRERPLDFFVLYSSVVAVAGTPGQSGYAAANAFLDALAEERHLQGLPALSVNWGAWAESGMAAQVSARERSRWSEQGIHLLDPNEAMRALEELLEREPTQVAVLAMDWDRYLEQFSATSEPPLYAELRRRASSATEQASGTTPLIRQLAEEVLPQKRRQRIESFVRETVARALGLAVGDVVDVAQPIREMGLDSLMAVEIRNALSAPVGERLPVALLYDYPTIETLTVYLEGKLVGVKLNGATRPVSPKPGPAAQSVQRADVSRASEAEAEEMLLKELEALNF